MLMYLALIEGEEQKRKFERLYRNYIQGMYYIAYKILKQKHAAEDAVHQAFLRLIDHLDGVDEADYDRTRAFLITITEHIAIDMYRRQKREHALSFETLEYSIADFAGDGGEDEVWLAVEKLPVNYAAVLELKFSQGYTNEEIAQILHISEENVRQRIARGKKKLSEILEEEGEL